jgi:hypothetical protein
MLSNRLSIDSLDAKSISLTEVYRIIYGVLEDEARFG